MYYIIANPNSDRGGTMFMLPTLTAFFDDAGIPYDTHITTAAGDALEETRKFCRNTKGLQGVIGIGGDGTMQEIVEGILDAFPTQPGEKLPVPLGILPSSIGSDFSLTFDGGKNISKAKAARSISERCKSLFNAIVGNQTKTIDVLTANGRPYLNVGHIGLDVEVLANANQVKQKYDQKSYAIVTLKTIMNYNAIPMEITTHFNGEETIIKDDITLVVVAGGQYYGGGMRICPTAKLDDGKISVCTIRNLSRVKSMLVFPFVLAEKHGKFKNVSFQDCQSVKIKLPPGPMIMGLDGSLYPVDGEVEFSILPGALDIFAQEGKHD
jgi:diacylglycerol kinase family enzyme